MNEDKDYELDKWDVILPIILVIALIIGMAIVGILVYAMNQNNQVEDSLQLQQSIITATSIFIY